MCDHETFESTCHVIRLLEVEAGPAVGYTAEVTIHCTQCQTPFRFLGLPGGVYTTAPTVSFDGTEARLPLAPSVLARAAGGAYD